MPQNSPTPPNPLTAGLPVTQAQTHTTQPPNPLSSPLTNSPIPAHLSYPSPASPKAKPDTPHAFPSHRHRPTRPSRPARYLPRSPVSSFPHGSPIQALLLPPKRSPTHPTLSRNTGTDPHAPAVQPAIFPVTNSPIPAYSSHAAPLTHIKIPEADRLRDFFVISGSVRSPSQRRLR